MLEQLQGEEVKLIAGGQSLMPMLNMRLVRPAHLVDLNLLRDLSYIHHLPDGTLAIGALTRHRAIEHSADVTRYAPLLAEAAPLVGDRLIRYRGTIGGSLAHADPSAEFPTVAVALDAHVVLARASGTRSIPASDFFVTFLTTAVEPDEVVVEIRFPSLPAGAGCAFKELARQHGVFAIVSAAAVIELEGGVIRNARIGLGGVASTPVRALQAESFLRGQRPGEEVFREAGRLAALAADPTSDVHGSAEYRREMTTVYTRLTLQEAASRAGESLTGLEE